MAAGVRYVGAKIAQYATATGQVVYSRIGTSNIVDNAYGVMNVAADGTTAVTGNPNSARPREPGQPAQGRGQLVGPALQRRPTNPGPAISPTTNPHDAGEPGQRHGDARDGIGWDDLQRGRLLPVPQRPAV